MGLLPQGFNGDPKTAKKSSVFMQAFSLARALLTGTNVSEERMQQRFEICKSCPLVVITPDEGGEETLSCGICECKVAGDKRLFNIARLEETSTNGCFFYGQGKPLDERSKWRKGGC